MRSMVRKLYSDGYTPWDKIQWPTDTIFRITTAEI